MVLCRRLRPITALVVASALSVGCWRWCHHDLVAALAGPSRAGLSALIAGLAAAVLQVGLGWLLLLTLLVALEPIAGRDLTPYVACPTALRRVLLGCCGAAAFGALAMPAQATPVVAAQTHHPVHRDQPASAVLDGLPLPDRTVGGLARPGREARSVLVRHGDTLWGIAAAQLPAGSTAGDVDRAWRALYAGNRSLIGSDPDLITPGIRLRLPPTPHQEDDR